MDEEKGDEHYYSESTSSSTPLVESDIIVKKRPPPWISRKSLIAHWVGHAILLLSLLLVLVLKPFRSSEVECWDRFNSYSPMREFVREHPYVPHAINGSKLYNSEFVGEASKISEDAWRDATEYGLLGLSEEEIKKVGYESWSAHFPTSAVPDGSYPVVVVGNHQLHCLHYLWQDHHLDYYEGRRKFKEKNPKMYEGHYEHCVDFLRQRLMCHYDMSVTPYQWVHGIQAPMPGAMTNEKCVDWEAMRKWMQKAQPKTPKGFLWEAPKDAVMLDAEP